VTKPIGSTEGPISSPQEHHNRRSFLLGLGLGGCVGMLAALVAPRVRTALSIDQPTPLPDGTGLAGIKQLLAGKKALTWVFTGDSITQGVRDTQGWRGYPEHFAERVRWEMQRFRDVVINTGIAGERTGGLLADLDWRVLRFQPDVLSLMIGMNDAVAGPGGRQTFRTNLRGILAKVMGAGALPLLHTPNLVYGKNATDRADLPAYADIVRELASESRLALVDHAEHWGRMRPHPEDLLAWLGDGSIHPNVYGHREIAKLIFRQLDIFDPKSPTCALEVP
jgi:acyl-CoA thioesterase-1